MGADGPVAVSEVRQAVAGRTETHGAPCLPHSGLITRFTALQPLSVAVV